MSNSRKTRGRGPKKTQGKGQAKGIASVQKIASGAAFLILEGARTEDLYLAPREASRFFDGDRLEVIWSPRHGTVEQARLLDRKKHEVFARFHRFEGGSSNRGFLIYERKKAREELWVPELPKGLKPGDWVKAEFLPPQGKHPFPAKVIEKFGTDLPASLDVEWVASEHGLSDDRPADVEREALAFKPSWKEELEKGRTDLRHVPFLTIDGETARDFDDAIHVERKGQHYDLWVAIADVSHYVTPGTALDRDAFERGTSVYFPERAFHMLPSALSENLCSLRPNEPRLALVAKISFTRQGDPIGTEIMDAVIESRRRATYEEVEKEHERQFHNPDWALKPHYELYAILRKARMKKGALDFDLPEPEIRVAPDGEPTSIRVRGRLDSHRLIEAFMVSANEAVTEWMLEKNAPFLFRIHAAPTLEALEAYRDVAFGAGVDFPLQDAASGPLAISKFLETLIAHPAKLLLHTALLRSMKQAVYSASHEIHFGLGSRAYTHFTSPIRRYPDLVVHRLIKKRIKGASPGKDAEAKETSRLDTIAAHCSRRERIATEAERESIKLKQTRFMVKRLGESFPARVTGVIERGIFLQIDDPFVEGFLSKDRLGGDFFVFEEKKMQLLGRKSRKRIKVGDEMRVIASAVSIEKRQIDFEPEDFNAVGTAMGAGEEIKQSRPGGGPKSFLERSKGRPQGGGGGPGKPGGSGGPGKPSHGDRGRRGKRR